MPCTSTKSPSASSGAVWIAVTLPADPQHTLTAKLIRTVPLRWSTHVLRLSLALAVALASETLMGGPSNALADDRTEAGLRGAVRTVVTIDEVVQETELYDAAGRLLKRTQESREPRDGLGRITFSSQFDASGVKQSDLMLDQNGAVIKQTVYVYDEREQRVAEVTAWADGRFSDASFYEYDTAGRRRRGIHFNPPNLVNRNLYDYDDQGRVVRERYSRNYTFEERTGSFTQLRGLTAGHELTIRYNSRGLIDQKVVQDLRGRRESRSEFDYDGQGQQIDERVYDQTDRLIARKQYEYAYDGQGNWIAETMQWWEFQQGKAAMKQAHARQRTLTYHSKKSR